MKRRLALYGLALTGLLVANRAAALSLALDPVTPATVGAAQTYKIASVTDASGPVKFRWNFGDGTPISDPSSDMQASHVYQVPGHYNIIVQGSDDAAGTSAVAVQTAANPLTPSAPHNSTSILFDPARHRVWNVNPDSDSVSATDSTTLTRLFEKPVGDEPHSIAQAPDGSLWVTNQNSDEVVVLDPDSGAVNTRIALAYASQPRTIAFGPTGKAYVSLSATGKLVEIDATSRQVTREVALGPTPAGVSVAANGRIFVTRFLSPVDHGEVWVVAPDTFTLVNTITLPFDLGPDTQSSGRGVPNYVSSIAISPDGTQAWVTAKKDDVARGIQRDGQPMTSDNFARSAVCTIDLKTEKEVIAKRQDIDNRSMPVAVVFSPIGDYAFVSVLTFNWVGVVDAYNAEIATGMQEVGNAPDGLVLTPDGRLFVNAFLSREVIVYDVSASLASADHGAPEPMARIKTIDREPLSAQLLLGKQIYYNAADKRMGHAGYWACATCHFGGYSDGRVWDFSDRGEGLRNTKSLLGIRGAQGQGRVHWTGNMDEIQDFERDIRESFDGDGFMPNAEYQARKGADGEYDGLGKPAAGVSPELDALAAYITSFDKVERSPFRNPDGSFTKDAREGRKIFASAGCPACHSGPDFTDSPQNVLHDVGTLLPTSGKRLFGPLTGIDTPTLKGLWQSAPYLHDGRAATLQDIFTLYTKDKMGITSNLSPTQLDQLVRYLLELDDVPETPAVDDPPAAAGAGSGGMSSGGASSGTGGATSMTPPADTSSSKGRVSCAVARVPSPTDHPAIAGWLAAVALGSVWRRSRRKGCRLANLSKKER
jgi:streptogramin lyase